MDTATKETGTALVEQTTGTALAAPIEDYSQLGVTGFEGQTREDYKIPFIRLLQPTSPAVVDNLNGARGGMWFNTVTKEVYEAIDFIAAITKHVFVEWEPRDEKGNLPADVANGGFIAVHEPESELVKTAKAASVEFGVYTTPDGKDLVETYYVFGTAIDPKTGDEIEAMIAFASTHIKSYQSWQTTARTQMFVNKNTGTKQPYPLFSHLFRLTSEKVEKGGNKWFVPVVNYAKGTAAESRFPAGAPEVARAVEIAKAIMQGTAKVDLSQAQSEGKTGGGSSAANDKDIPF